MERRELLRNGAGALALVGVPPGFERCSPVPVSHDDFYELLNEERAAFRGEEYRRAYDLNTQALERLPAGESSSVCAEILEGRKRLEEILDSAEKDVACHGAATEVGPADGEGHYWFALALTRAGRDDEALVEYQSALALNYDKAGCWYGIGLSHCRQRRYQEALPWFECIVASAQPTSAREIITKWRALEQRLVIYSELGLVREAEEATRYHIRCYGRLGSRERRRLEKARR
jgi:tetratricopeptide (TPR) repeat protein